MGRAGLQHRRNYGSDKDGFQPGGSGEINTYNTAHCHTNNCTNGHTTTCTYSYPMADLPMATHRYPTAEGYPTAYIYPMA